MRLLVTFDAKRSVLEPLLSPKPARVKARKVRYLTYGVEPTVDSFRTICELRPVFERQEGKETIVGYASVVVLEVELSDAKGEEQTVRLHFPPAMLKRLRDVVKRTEKKLEAIEAKLGPEFLGDSIISERENAEDEAS